MRATTAREGSIEEDRKSLLGTLGAYLMKGVGGDVICMGGRPYPTIAAESFRRVSTVRHRFDDGASYFGPYTNAKSIRSTRR